ncbi:MAG: helix-turn-helix transcriptional regulator [Thermodesulfobacteriota bacterium]|nr:helix-turn-helix transcriptional regulator [Thermodesulfobacteriota bacterium]
MPVADKLKIARKSLGKNQKEMAKAVEIAHRSWQGYEQGVNFPGGKVFAALAELGFNTNWFFTDDQDVPMRIGVVTQVAQGGDGQSSVLENKEVSELLNASQFDNLGLGEAVELLAKIFSSGEKVLIRAINANLLAFSDNVDSKARAAKDSERLAEITERMEKMEEKLQRMDQILEDHNRLARENNELRARLDSTESKPAANG